MNKPAVDILMATYNGERYVAEQIESIRAQTYKNWHLLVSDDCSTDGTLDMVKDYEAEDPRIRVTSEGVRHGGAKENFMALLDDSSAPYAMFCDQDDIWLPGKVERELEVLVEAEQESGADCPIVVHSDLQLVDAQCNPMGKKMSETLGVDSRSASPLQVLYTGCVTGGATAINRACVSKALCYRDLSNIVMHDWWVALIGAFLGRRVFIDEPLVSYRQHSDNVIGAAVTSVSQTVDHYSEAAREAGLAGIKNRVDKNIVSDELRYLKQDEEFLKCFSQDLSHADIDAIRRIIAMPSVGMVQRFITVCSLRLWRCGLRNKARQILALLLMDGQL